MTANCSGWWIRSPTCPAAEIRMYGGNLAAYDGASRGRAGGGGTRGHRGLRRRPPGAARPRRRAGQAGQARPAGPQGRRLGQPPQDRRGRAQASTPRRPRAGPASCTPSASQAARDRLDEAEQAVRDDAEIRVELPGTAVPAGRTVLTVTGLAGAHWHPASAAAAAEHALAAPPTADPAGRARGAHRPRPGADRPGRTERRGQDHPAARDRGPGRAPRASMSGWERWSVTCRSGSISSTTR